MSDTNEITAVSIAVQVGGKPYFVNLSNDKMLLLMNLAGSLSDDGKLHVVPAPDGYKFVSVGDLA